MNIWVYIDNANRIMSLNENDMTGNTGWHGTTVEKLGFGADQTIVNENGVPIYTYADGAAVARSAEEVAADYTPPVHQPTDAERIRELEEQNAMLTECLLEMSEIVYA